jgi:phage terminase Nu1 subunit (DNA packaging protein)
VTEQVTKPTLRALADRLGVVHSALSKAVREGRLTAGVMMDRGRVVVLDADAAAAQWNSVSASMSASGSDANADYLAARARREAALADIAEIDRDERRGELVSVEEARADVIDAFTVVKTRILGVSSRVAQRMPHLAAEVVPVLDALLREALEELAADVAEE